MQAIVPVILTLQKDASLELKVVTSRISSPVLEQFGIDAEALDENLFDRNPAGCIQAVLDRTKPRLVVSGSSPARGASIETPEQYMIREARARGIRSLAVLDTWGQYLARFPGLDGRVDEGLVPDRLCVLDSICRNDLIEMGLPEDRLVVTHNPWLDRILNPVGRQVRPMLGDEPKGWTILYVSQPLAEFRPHRDWSYDQEDILFGLVEALVGAGRGRGHRIQIWAHQAEDPQRWRDQSRFRRPEVEVFFDVERGDEVFDRVDFVVTSHSTLVYEALHHGTPCISFRPGGTNLPPLITDRLKLAPVFTGVDGLRNYLSKMDVAVERQRILDKRRSFIQEKIFFNDGMATARVASEILSML